MWARYNLSVISINLGGTSRIFLCLGLNLCLFIAVLNKEHSLDHCGIFILYPIQLWLLGELEIQK